MPLRRASSIDNALVWNDFLIKITIIHLHCLIVAPMVFRSYMVIEHEFILLAEDDPDHILLIRHAFKQAGLINPLQIVRSGEEAIAYLEGSGKFSNRAEYPLPSLFLLDLKMPRKDGFE